MKKGQNNLLVFTGNANPKLAKDICNFLKIKLSKASIGKFSDGEIHVKIERDGIRLWRTTRTARGTRVRIVGLATRVASKEDIKVELPIFQHGGLGKARLGESNEYK